MFKKLVTAEPAVFEMFSALRFVIGILLFQTFLGSLVNNRMS